MKGSGFMIFALVVFAEQDPNFQSCKEKIDVVLISQDSAELPDSASYNFVSADGTKNVFAVDPPETLIKSFLGRIENNLDLSTDQVHVAFQTYGDTDKIIFDLNKFNETTNARSAILATKFARTGSNPPIARALDYTYNNVLTVSNGERSCSPTVVVLLSYSDSAQRLIAVTAAKRLRNLGALIVTIGIGPRRDPGLLIQIASDPSYYFDYKDFTELTDTEADRIAAAFCKYIPTNTVYPYNMDAIVADVVFVVDVSPNMYAITPANARLIDGVIDFANNFLMPMKFGPDGVQAALVTYSKTDDENIKLNKFKTYSAFMDAFNQTMRYGPTGTDRNLANALDGVARHILTTADGMRANVAHMVFVFAADCFTGKDPVPFSDDIRTIPADLYLITLGLTNTFLNGIGAHAPSSPIKFWKEAWDVAGHPSKLFNVPAADSRLILSTYFPTVAWNLVFAESANYITTAAPTSPASPTSESCKEKIDVVLISQDSAELPDSAFYNLVSADGTRNIFAADPPETLLKRFLAHIVQNFDLNNDQVHVAFQTYGDTDKTIFNLNKFNEMADAKYAILTTKFARAGTNPPIGRALNYTYDNVLTVLNGKRSCYPTVVVLLSYASNTDLNPNEATLAISAAKRLRDDGALIVTIGVGPERDANLLIKIASDISYYFDYKDFTELTYSWADKIAAAVCMYAPTNRRCFQKN